MNETALQRYQQDLVEYLKKTDYLKTPLVEEAFMKVPRHLFLPGEPLDKVYSDIAIVMKRGEEGIWTSSSSQPAIMAIMLEQLDLKPGQHVLEIGAGTGFNAGLIASIVGPSGKVVTVDIQPDLIEHARKCLDAVGYDWVETIVGDGGYGYPEVAPYDRIILTVASEVITPSWKDQLAQDGILVLPFDVIEGFQRSVTFQKRGEELVSVDIKACGFMPLQGAFGIAQPLRTPLGTDPRLCMFSAPGKVLPVEADMIANWLSQEGQDLPSGVTLTLGEFLNDFSPWVALHESQGKQQTMARVSIAALGDLAEQNIIPSLFGFDGDMKAMYSAAVIEPNGMAAVVRPPGQPAPLIDMFNPDDKYNTTFELHVRILGSGTNAAKLVLEHIQGWEQAGRPTSFRWHIRAIPAETEYQPTDDELLVNKPWTKLIISYE